MRLILALVLAGSLFGADEQKEIVTLPIGLVLPQIVAGGAWSTDIQVMHADVKDVPVGFNLHFFGADGLAMNLPVVGLGMVSVVPGVVQARTAILIQIEGGEETLSGYAILGIGAGAVAVMNAVLTQKIPGRPDFQASVPGLSAFMTDIQFPFRNDGPYTTTLALLGMSDQSVTAIARGENGSELCRTTYDSVAFEHGAGLLTDLLPCTDGTRGAVQFTADGLGGSLIAFLFNDFGAFTTQIPYEICCR